MPDPAATTSFTSAPAFARNAITPDRLSANQHSFAAALGRADSSKKSAPEAAHDAAEQFITQTLILPLLKQLRSGNNAAPPFAPTQAERQFGALQDAETAQRIAHATRFPLMDRLARDLLRKSGIDAPELRPPLLSAPITPPPLNLGAARLASPR